MTQTRYFKGTANFECIYSPNFGPSGHIGVIHSHSQETVSVHGFNMHIFMRETMVKESLLGLEDIVLPR